MAYDIRPSCSTGNSRTCLHRNGEHQQSKSFLSQTSIHGKLSTTGRHLSVSLRNCRCSLTRKRQNASFYSTTKHYCYKAILGDVSRSERDASRQSAAQSSHSSKPNPRSFVPEFRISNSPLKQGRRGVSEGIIYVPYGPYGLFSGIRSPYTANKQLYLRSAHCSTNRRFQYSTKGDIYVVTRPGITAKLLTRQSLFKYDNFDLILGNIVSIKHVDTS